MSASPMSQREQEQQEQQQMSFHFWNCQLTQANSKYFWDPENWAGATAATESRQRRAGHHGNGESKGDTNGDGEKPDKVSDADNGHANGDANGDGEKNGGADATAADADYMQHVLKVNACILGPQATGIHVISVRTKCYKAEPDTCPIVCIDPATQRTVTLGYEFVLDSQNEVTFLLTEGTGPVWLTGLHQVRLHEPDADSEGEGDCCESIEIDEASRFRLAYNANGSGGGDIVEEVEEGEGEGEDEDEDEDEDADEEAIMKDGVEGDDSVGKGSSSSSSKVSERGGASKPGRKPLGKRSPITTEQLRSRKRLRLGESEAEAAATE